MVAAYIIFLGLLPLLMLLGIPIAYSLGLTALAYMIYDHTLTINYQLFAQRMMYGINNFTLLAVPFFIFAANLMNSSGITRRLFRFADILVGYLPGGLGQVNIIASVIFAGMTGSAVSDAAGLGTIELEAMKEAGYDLDFSAAITAASSTIGPIIPPSIPMVIYGVSAGASVGALLLAGIVPGLLMAVALMIMVALHARGKGYPVRKRPTLRELILGALEALPSLFMPLIIIGGIYWGWFTPTEASVVAATYALILAGLIYRELSFSRLVSVIFETMKSTAVVAFIVSTASIYGWLLMRSGIPIYLTQSIASLNLSATGLLFVIVLFLLLVGMFMEPVSALMIMTPILVPIVKAAHVDLVHFGVIMVLTLMIGLLTPPVGVVLYVVQRVANIPFDRLVRAVFPYLLPLLVVAVLLILFPGLATWIPRMAMGR